MMERTCCCSTCSLSVAVSDSIQRIKVTSTPSSLCVEFSFGETECLVTDACKLFLLTISGDSFPRHFVFTLNNWPFCVKRTQHSQLETRRPESFIAFQLPTWALEPEGSRREGKRIYLPFDRMVIAQARAESFTVVTRDTVFRRYGIPIIQA